MLLTLALCALLPAPPQETAPTASEVVFASGDIQLAGTLHVPPGPGPFPAAVLVHGSGDSDRSNPWTAAYAAGLLARGVAVLHPDKRGSGASGGDWRDATFEELAADALAAVELLRAHPRVDATRTGLVGFSQGGHVVPVAAARSDAVAFVVDVSGSLVPMREQLWDEVRMSAEDEGLGRSELEDLRRLHELGLGYARAGAGWDAYAVALAAAEEGPLGERGFLRGFPDEPDAAAWSFLRTLVDFDPLPWWRQVEVPALFLFGGRDRNIDVPKSVALLQRSLAHEGPPYTLLLFSRNGHALHREDALDLLARWIHDRGAG